MTPSPDNGAAVKSALAAAHIRLIGQLHISLRGGYVLTAYIEPLRRDPNPLCQKLMKHLAALDTPCGVTWSAEPGEPFEALAFAIVPLETKP